MPIIINKISDAIFEDWLEEENITVVVNEEPIFGTTRFYASALYLLVVYGVSLLTVEGNGKTPEAAIENLAKHLSMKNLVWQASGRNRREFKAPRFVKALKNTNSI
jgi:hypothetical protein